MYLADPHDPTIAAFHRGTCTEQAWKSGLCPQHCITDFENNGAPVNNCNRTTTQNSFCCGEDCDCAKNTNTFSFAGANYSTITIISEAFTRTSTVLSSSSTSTTAATITSTSTTAANSASTSPPASADEEQPKKKSNTAAIGAGVAVPLVLLALAGVAFFFWRRKKATKGNAGVAYNGEAHEVANNEYYPPQGAGKYAHDGDTHGHRDVKHAYIAPQELAAVGVAPVELSGETAPKR